MKNINVNLFKYSATCGDEKFPTVESSGYVTINRDDEDTRFAWSLRKPDLDDEPLGNVLQICDAHLPHVELPAGAKVLGKDEEGTYYYVPTNRSFRFFGRVYVFSAEDFLSAEGDNILCLDNP